MRKFIILIYTLLAAVIFTYGFAVAHFKIFPFQQLQSLVHQFDPRSDYLETDQQEMISQDVQVLDTFLTRLFIKKIPVPNYIGYGGGLSTAEDWLFLITNNGSVRTYNLDTYSVPEFNIPDVPMNLDALIESGHLYKNDFRHRWFRVNGVYAEHNEGDGTITLFASHNGYDPDRDCITHNISRLLIESDAEALNSSTAWETIFSAEPCIDPEPDYILAATPYPGHISGGDIALYDTQRLLVTVGDYNRHGIDGTDEYAMDPDIPYGKHILVDKKSGEWSVYSMGHRNPSGVHIDRNGVIWSVENGPEAGDELNIISKGENYGWPRVSYGFWYDSEFSLPGGQKYGSHHGYKEPVFSWIPAVAPSSITKIEGEKFELWNGDLLMGTMGDRSLHRMRLDSSNRVTYNERIHIGHRIRDMITLPDEKIALLTDDGFLIFIEDGGVSFESLSEDSEIIIESLNQYDQFIKESDRSEGTPTVRDAKMIYEQNCISCHNLHPNSEIGPHLNNLFNREVGGADDFNYSQTLRSDTRVWNRDLLESFLKYPDKEFMGNRMQQVQLTPAEIDSVIQFLKNETGN
ncbi:MAG: PQQ-dependent sugar dehydrogenase [Balneolaceae bacterium]|nr:PQQ-dependent sugar dehydrogenase [Balneolaceae bacterium]MCH8549209.1 PQQ-dependent sugar dehydrogenase [Balneolaceae bacterium]